MSADAAEADRLASVYASGLLDTADEEDFDRLVALAAEICGTPMALVPLVDAQRQWFKSRVGFDADETPRAVSFCDHAMAGAEDVVEVSDARLDERFSANPFVTGEPYVRFYAAAVLRDRQGRGLGTLCVLDSEPRHLSDAQLDALATLGRQVEALIELRRESTALAHAETALGLAAEGGARRAIITLDADLRILGWSGDAERLYGYPAASVTGRVLTTVLKTNVTSEERKSLVAALERQGEWEGELTHYRRNGSPVRVRARVVARHDRRGNRVGYVLRNDDLTSPDIERLCHETYVDIVTKMANGRPLALLSADLCRVIEAIFPETCATLMAVDGETGTLGVVAAPSLSASFSEAFAAVPVGPTIGSCGTAAHLAQVVVCPDLFEDPAWEGWRETPRAEGLVACWSHPIIGPAGTVLGTFAVYRDRRHVPDDDERQLVSTLASLAAIVLTARRTELGGDRPDELTGLATRAGLDRALARLASDAEVCIVALDIDRFGLVNRQYGLDIGDRALRRIAERVSLVGVDAAVVARFVSDQFVLVTSRAGSGRDLAEALVGAMRTPIEIDGNELWLTASVGVARGPAAQAQTVMQAAVGAAGRARRLGGNQALDADLPSLDLGASSLELVGELHRAVASGALRVHYQPKLAIATGEVESLEALVRWSRGDGTPVAPSEFVPLAEEIGLIEIIGGQVLRQACADAAGWAVGPSGIAPGVSVNISSCQLVAGQLAATVTAALNDSGLPGHRLTLEVTETALVNDLDSAIGALREVKAQGVRIAIDDFGVGYSSLGYLSRFPIDELKIDCSFIERMGQDPAVDAIVRSVIALSHTLGLRCTAEGVERDDQLAHLAALGCDAFQGFLFSPAVPNESVARLLGQRLPSLNGSHHAGAPGGTLR